MPLSRGQSETSVLFWTWYRYLEKKKENLQTSVILARTPALPPAIDTHSLTAAICLETIKTNLVTSLSSFVSVPVRRPGLPGPSSSLFWGEHPHSHYLLSPLPQTYLIHSFPGLLFSVVLFDSHLIVYFVNLCLFSFNTKIYVSERDLLCIFCSRPRLHHLEKRQAHGKHPIMFW